VQPAAQTLNDSNVPRPQTGAPAGHHGVRERRRERARQAPRCSCASQHLQCVTRARPQVMSTASGGGQEVPVYKDDICEPLVVGALHFASPSSLVSNTPRAHGRSSGALTQSPTRTAPATRAPTRWWPCCRLVWPCPHTSARMGYAAPRPPAWGIWVCPHDAGQHPAEALPSFVLWVSHMHLVRLGTSSLCKCIDTQSWNWHRRCTPICPAMLSELTV